MTSPIRPRWHPYWREWTACISSRSRVPGAVTGGADTTFHFPVERAVEESSPEWTHVRPGEFMLNKLFRWGPSIRAEGVVCEPFPDVAS